MHDITKLVRHRRTTKPSKMKAGGRVPDAVIWEALENASWAPNHGKTEPWYFIVFTGDGLTEFCNKQGEMYKEESGIKFNTAKYQNLRDWQHTVSHAIAIVHRRMPAVKIPEIEEIEAIACGVQNMALTIEAHGYAGMWSTGGITYYESARELLDLQDYDKMLGFFLVGEKREEVTGVPRVPINEKVRWVIARP